MNSTTTVEERRRLIEAQRREKEQRIREMMEYQEVERQRLAERRNAGPEPLSSTYARIDAIRKKNQEKPKEEKKKMPTRAPPKVQIMPC